ncbi:MAG: M48 family metallopeptidase, partial [Simkaniaceae bacterium]|nr:M48 family metallopeptidase [Simkaniaceae bacterium]
TWLLSIPIMLLFQVIAPVWIDPIFNRYGPMKDKKLEQQILQLAECAGIEGSRVYEVDRSKDTKMMNAYVTGFGQTKRIVLTDTIIQGMSAKELLFVMGHEMGHYVLHHMWYGLAYFSCLALLGLYLIDKLAKSAIRKFSIKFRFTHLGDIASLPLLLVLFQAFMLLSTPLSNYVSRVMEHEADIFGLEITKDNRAAAEAFVKLQRENLAYPRPGPIYIFWRSTHPPLGQRVDFCNSYRPWVRGVPLKYAAKFNRCQSSRDPL